MEQLASDQRLLRKVTARIIPFLFLLYIIAFLDRVNVGFAKLQMNHLPWFSEAVYGVGAGIFFVGYFLFEVPSNLILAKIGARWWIARIMVTWGLVAAAMIFTNSPTLFYVLRFLLGVAEAGFFPGMILYLTYWYTRPERARIIGLFMTAIPTANAIGSPISGKLLELNGAGLHGWQWLFLLEAAPAVIMGFVVLLYLPNGPADARWLTLEEKDRLEARLEDEHVSHAPYALPKIGKEGLKVILPFILIYFTVNIAGYGMTLWLPQIIDGFGKRSTFQVGLLTSLPFVIGAIGMVLVGASADRMKERRLHVAFCLFATSLGLATSAFCPHAPLLALSALTLAAIGVNAVLGPFWAMSTGALSRTAAAGGIALINSIGNLGGLVGPSGVGWIKSQTGGYLYPLLALSVAAMAGGLVAVSLKHPALISPDRI